MSTDQMEAKSLIVTTAADVVDAYDGVTSLREAVAYAKELGGEQTITFDNSISTIDISSQVQVTSAVSIQADINQNVILNGSQNSIDRILFCTAKGTVSLSNLTFVNGSHPSDHGGALHNWGNMTIEDCIFENNSADQYGGAISSGNWGKATLVVKGATFNNNSAEAGGAIWHHGISCIIDNCTFSANTASQYGGAIYASDGDNPGTCMTIKDSSFLTSSDTIYHTTGALTLEGTITLAANFYSESTVNAEGATINYLLSSYDAANTTVIVSDVAKISGASYTVSVKADQTMGTYQLAGNAAEFNDTLSLTVGETTYDNVLTIGNKYTVGGRDYTLALNDSNVLTLNIAEASMYTVSTVTGKFTGKGGAFQLMSDGTASIGTNTARTTLSGTIDVSKWQIIGTGDFGGRGVDGLLWLEKATRYVYMQYDMSCFDEVNQKSNCLGMLESGYSMLGTGDFSGSGIDGALLQGPSFGDKRISLNYGLPVWARESDGSRFDGWLGALVNTWQEGDSLKGNLSDLASINANNYRYAVVGVGDFNGDGRDDIMLQNTMPSVVTQDGVDYTITGSGDVFTFLTGDKQAIIRGANPTVAYAGCAIDGWEILGTGDFDSDGIDDVLLGDGSHLAGWKMSNGQRTGDFWFGALSDGEEFAGIADFNNDGTDDILIRTAATETLKAWTVQNGKMTGTIAIA